MKVKTQKDLDKLVIRANECTTDEAKEKILGSVSFDTEELVKSACERIFPDFHVVVIDEVSDR